MKKLLTVILFYLPFQFLLSETLVLKDGTIIKMTLKAQDVDTLTYTLKGKEFKVPKGKIRRVVYAKTPELEEKIAKEEVQKMKQEKAAKKPTKTKDEEQEEAREEARLLEEEIAKALEEQRKQELLNLSFEERIKKLETEVSELKSLTGENAKAKIERMEGDIEDLRKRTRRMEKFLDVDPDIEDYYSKPRSMWSIVWRSALVPGWGLTYGRDSGLGSVYTSLFIVTSLGGAGYKASLNSLEKSIDDKLITDLIVQPLLLSTFASASASTVTTATTATSLSTDLKNYQNSYNTPIKLYKYIQSKDDFNQQVANADKVLAAAAGIYALQLIHSAIYGYFWAKRTPRKFSEEKTTGWNIQLSPLAKRNPITNNQDWQMDVGYRFEF
ncbi:MAG TPA: hypothetical protein PLX69_10660 [Leptospiraceae bacterium]|nr:hypothetical protein [Leptospiraceae bacterium]